MSATVTAETPVIEEKWEALKLSDCDKYVCPLCDNEITFHPNYFKHNAVGCIRCEKLETIVKKMLKCRNYELISIDKEKIKDAKYIISFKCSILHNYKQSWSNLRRGCGCTTCNSKKKKKKITVKNAEIEPCNCKELKKGISLGGRYICDHYNFAVICPEAFKDWCFELNTDINPLRTAPSSQKNAFFKCSVFNQIYSQSLCNIYQGAGCPYCFGNFKVCLETSLYTTHPEIAKNWHPDNELKPWEVFAGSNKNVWWKCDKEECGHKYERSPHHQTGDNNPGCPKCAPGYEQRIGGHEHFIKIAREVHGNKYEYPEKIANITDNININCPVKSSVTGLLHGLFSQSPSMHKLGQGCPKCSQERTDSLGVTIIKEFLTKWRFLIKVHYFTEHTIVGLNYVGQLRLDFYIKENVCQNLYPIVIEFDHKQHFKDVPLWGSCEKNMKRDLCKDLFCMQNKISVIRIPYTHTITENYLANLIRKCQADKLCYFSYKHYEEHVAKKIDLSNVYIENVYLPPRFSNIKCSFEEDQ